MRCVMAEPTKKNYPDKLKPCLQVASVRVCTPDPNRCTPSLTGIVFVRVCITHALQLKRAKDASKAVADTFTSDAGLVK